MGEAEGEEEGRRRGKGEEEMKRKFAHEREL